MRCAQSRKTRVGGSRNTTVGTIATSIVTAPLFIFMKGEDITIPKGTEVTAYVHGDVRLEEARIRAHPLNASTEGETAAATPVPAAAPVPASPGADCSGCRLLHAGAARVRPRGAVRRHERRCSSP